MPWDRGHVTAEGWCRASWRTSLLLAHLLLLTSLARLNAARVLLIPSTESVSQLATRKVRVGSLHTPYKRLPYGLNFTEGVKVASTNSGNRIWSYGADRLFDRSAVEWVSGDELRGATQTLQQGNNSHHRVDVFLLGTANLFFNESVYSRVEELTHVYMNMIKAYNAPTIMVGLGTQAYFTSGMQLGSAAGVNWKETDLKPSDFFIHPEQRELYMVIKNTSGEVTVRGAFTADAIVANGLPPPLVLGCPSLFINHDPNLGASLEARRNAVLAARDYDNLRLAIGLPHIGTTWRTQSRPLVQLIADVLKVFPKSFVVVQTPDDLGTIRLMHVHGVDLGPERVKYFYDPEHWIEAIRDSADFLFSFRIHGTMAGTAAGVPAVVISTDHRIAELAEAMRLPHTRLQDRGFDVQPFDLFDFITTVPFDGKAFDLRRTEIAKQYAELFGRLKLPLNPGITRIAAGNVNS